MNKPFKILLVDDEEDIVDILSIHLNRLGWETETLLHPSEALEVLESGDFFLLITDIAMPEMSGDELIKEVKSKLPHIEVIIMTGFGYDPTHTLLNLHKNYDCPILMKPFNLKDGIIEEKVSEVWNKFKSKK